MRRGLPPERSGQAQFLGGCLGKPGDCVSSPTFALYARGVAESIGRWIAKFAAALLGRLAQLTQQAVAIRNVHGLQFLELRKRGAGGNGVMAVTFQFCDDLALPRQVSFALGDVPFGLGEMILEDAAFHVPRVSILGRRRNSQQAILGLFPDATVKYCAIW